VTRFCKFCRQTELDVVLGDDFGVKQVKPELARVGIRGGPASRKFALSLCTVELPHRPALLNGE
jgi:hypothetical protein